MALIRSLNKEQYPFRCAIESVIIAACWPPSRVAAVYPEESAICPRCEKETADSLHTFWTCECNAGIEDDAVTSTQSLHNHADTPCLWFRGILPEPFVSVADEYLPLESITGT